MTANLGKLTPHEVQSGYDRQSWAEGLIKQLPETHDGRNSWLLNFGRGPEAEALRNRHPAGALWFDPDLQAVGPPHRFERTNWWVRGSACRRCGHPAGANCHDVRP